MNPDYPLVSIGMTVFNAARFVGETLDSILTQDYPNFELIISDNASEDGSWEICQQRVAGDRRIQLHRNPTNVGSRANWNRVLELARGEYFLWASDHDLFAPSYISRCVSVLEQDPQSVLAYSYCRWIDADGKPLGDSPTRLDTRCITNRLRRVAYTARHLKDCPMIHGVIRAAPLKSLGGFPDCYSFDVPLLCMLAYYGAFAQIGEVLFYSRENRPGAFNRKLTETIVYEIVQADPGRAALRVGKSLKQLRKETRDSLMAQICRLDISMASKIWLCTSIWMTYRARYGIPTWAAIPIRRTFGRIIPTIFAFGKKTETMKKWKQSL